MERRAVGFWVLWFSLLYEKNRRLERLSLTRGWYRLIIIFIYKRKYLWIKCSTLIIIQTKHIYNLCFVFISVLKIPPWPCLGANWGQPFWLVANLLRRDGRVKYLDLQVFFFFISTHYILYFFSITALTFFFFHISQFTLPSIYWFSIFTV